MATRSEARKETASSSSYADEEAERATTAAEDSKTAKISWCDLIQFHNHTEAQGYAVITSARGSIVMANVFLSSGLIYLAQEAAGCFEGGIDPQETCSLRIYGFKPSSLVTFLAAASLLLSVICMPVFGALIDFTSYRRQVGLISSVLLTAIQAAQAFTNSSTWFVMSMLQIVAGILFEIQLVMSQAYLPDVSSSFDESTMASITASFSMGLFLTEFLDIVVVVALTTVLSWNHVNTARFSQGINSIYIACMFYLGWCRLLPDVEVQHEKSMGNILVAGFRQIYRTLKGINTHYKRTLRWFFLTVAFVNAGALSLTNISVTYMTVVLKMDSAQLGIMFFVTIFAAIPGAAISIIPTRATNPKISWQINSLLLTVVTALAGLFLRGPEDTFYIYIFGGLWGLLLGWLYATITIFYSMCQPKGQQTELSGFFSHCRLIISWAPSLVFTIMNEAGISMHYGLISLAGFFFCGFLCLSLAAPWEEFVELSKEQSKNIVE